MNAEELFSLNDLSQGLNEWKSIQYVVRETFKKFHEVLQSQSDAINRQASAISRIEKTLENKTSKSEVQAGLNLKANISEVGVVNRRISELALLLEDKLDKAELASELSKKASTAELSSRFTEVVSMMDERLQFRKDITKLQPTPTKNDSRLEEEIEKLKVKLDQKASNEELRQVAASKVDGSEFTSTINEIVQHANEISETLNSKVIKFLTILILKASIKFLESQLDREKKSLKSDIQSLRANLETTIQRNTEEVEIKKDNLNTSFKEAERDLKKMETQFQKREDVLNAKISQLTTELEEIKKMLLQRDRENELLKKEIVTELDLKANVEDVNQVLTDLTKEVSQKVDELKIQPAEPTSTSNSDNTKQKEQHPEWSLVPHSDSSARWLWKNKKTKVGCTVPWNVQCLNTSQQCFVWEKNAASIVIMLPGLYELIFAFFCRNQNQTPQIQLLLNGQPVTSSALATEMQTHVSGNITGHTFVDFFALPSKCKLSVTYRGDMDAEAFLSLRKL